MPASCAPRQPQTGIPSARCHSPTAWSCAGRLAPGLQPHPLASRMHRSLSHSSIQADLWRLLIPSCSSPPCPGVLTLALSPGHAHSSCAAAPSPRLPAPSPPTHLQVAKHLGIQRAVVNRCTPALVVQDDRLLIIILAAAAALAAAATRPWPVLTCAVPVLGAATAAAPAAPLLAARGAAPAGEARRGGVGVLSCQRAHCARRSHANTTIAATPATAMHNASQLSAPAAKPPVAAQRISAAPPQPPPPPSLLMRPNTAPLGPRHAPLPPAACCRAPALLPLQSLHLAPQVLPFLLLLATAAAVSGGAPRAGAPPAARPGAAAAALLVR